MFRCLFALLVPAVLVAQHVDSLPSAGSIRGTVVDAASALPLNGATVTLGPSDAFGAFPPQRGSYQLSAARTTVTKASGVYVFSDLSRGRYRLYVQRLGYEPVALDVELHGSAAPDVSVGLVVVPVRLQPVRVQGIYDNTYGRALAGTATEGEARVAAARQRQRDFLGTDVRELTYADVIEAATLGGSDLFRALRRLPGVGGYDDFRTELWIRGATWNETRTTFDGIPLIEPMHAGGTLAGVGTDAIGAAFLHPGVRPVSLSGDGAALVDLRSRPGGGDGQIRSTAELSMVGSQLAFDQRSPSGRYDWTVAARRSFDDWLPQWSPWLAGGLEHSPRTHYTEVSARGDASLGHGRSVTTSALFTKDYVESQLTDGNPSVSGWGNVAVKSTLRLPVGALLTEHSIGVSHFGSRSEELSLQILVDTGLPHTFATEDLSAKRSSADYLTIGGLVRPATDADASWSVGYAWTLQRAGYRIPRHLLSWGDLSEETRVNDGRLEQVSLWGERRWQIGSRLVADGGVRVDAGGHIGNTASVRPAPTLQLRYSIGGATFMSAGAGRSYQYQQEVAIVPAIVSNRWSPGIPLLANGDNPAIIADQFNLGVEQWRNGGILLTANAYARRLGGIAMRNLPPDDLAAPDLFTPTTVRSYGAELGVRKLTGRLTGAINYSYNHATARDSAGRFTAIGDRPHSLDATAMTRLGGVRFGGALTVTSGAPYTRIEQGTLDFDPTKGFFWRTNPTAGPLNAHRMPTFQSVDLLTDWTFHVHGSSVTTFFQVQNALDRVNLSWYYGNYCVNPNVGGTLDRRTRCAGPDLLYSPVERVATGGIRVAF